ncbi:ExbD/TolR family protein [Phycisphaerales bacterium AB-hyl4]|uniref:ExbD/TolR family protein n=1 Tax=Natronomicrosphaera hydrolytica TaxID=3242702 RepID=A0ABV4U2D2_9BACT
MSTTRSASMPGEGVADATVHHKSARQRRGLAPPRMQLNLAAMIDVVFQLLIYFVVTANFVVDEGVLTATLPTGTGEAADSLEPPSETLDLRLGSTGDVGVIIQLGGIGRVDTFTELANELDSLQFDPARGRHAFFAPDDPVVIRPEGDVRWQHVVNAFNAAIKARYTNVNFAQPE